MRTLNQIRADADTFDLCDEAACEQATRDMHRLIAIIDEAEANLVNEHNTCIVQRLVDKKRMAASAYGTIERRLWVKAKRRRYVDGLMTLLALERKSCDDMTPAQVRQICIMHWGQLETHRQLDPLEDLTDTNARVMCECMSCYDDEAVGVEISKKAMAWLRRAVDADLLKYSQGNPDPGMKTEEELDRRDRAREAGQ